MHDHSVILEATSRVEHGNFDEPITYEEYRRRAIQKVAIMPQPEANPNIDLNAPMRWRNGETLRRQGDAAEPRMERI